MLAVAEEAEGANRGYRLCAAAAVLRAVTFDDPALPAASIEAALGFWSKPDLKLLANLARAAKVTCYGAEVLEHRTAKAVAAVIFSKDARSREENAGALALAANLEEYSAI